MAPPRKRLDLAEVTRMRAQGLGTRRIAELLGTSRGAILRALADADADHAANLPVARADRIEFERDSRIRSGGSDPPRGLPSPAHPSPGGAAGTPAGRVVLDPEEVQARSDAAAALRRRAPYDAPPEALAGALAELERTMDDAPEATVDAVVEAALADLARRTEEMALAARRRKEEAERRAAWRTRALAAFRRAWRKEKRFELARADEDERAAARKLLKKAWPRALGRFKHRLERLKTGANFGAAVDSVVEETFDDALGEDDERRAEEE